MVAHIVAIRAQQQQYGGLALAIAALVSQNELLTPLDHITDSDRAIRRGSLCDNGVEKIGNGCRLRSKRECALALGVDYEQRGQKTNGHDARCTDSQPMTLHEPDRVV